jgi:hypothetical protein
MAHIAHSGFGGAEGPKSSFGLPSFGNLAKPKAQAPTFFSEYKKGEIGDMRDALNRAIHARKPEEVTLVLRKIIAAMTLGMDVSDLFQNIIMVCFFSERFIYLTGVTHHRRCTEKDDLSLLEELR